jgi:hypothetical protein
MSPASSRGGGPDPVAVAELVSGDSVFPSRLLYPSRRGEIPGQHCSACGARARISNGKERPGLGPRALTPCNWTFCDWCVIYAPPVDHGPTTSQNTPWEQPCPPQPSQTQSGRPGTMRNVGRTTIGPPCQTTSCSPSWRRWPSLT